MSEIRVSQTGHISAAPAVVYECLANYKDHHSRILPESFSDFRVESGGHGAGTVMTFKTRALGQTRSWKGTAAEPEPRRLLTETYEDGTVTSFLVEPEDGGTRLTIETHWTPRGLQGLFERLFAPSLMKSVYKQEMANIDAYTRKMSEG
jgi:hypothetical protein